MTKTEAKGRLKVGAIRADGMRFWRYYKTLSGIKEFWVTQEKFDHYICCKKMGTKLWNARQK